MTEFAFYDAICFIQFPKECDFNNRTSTNYVLWNNGHGAKSSAQNIKVPRDTNMIGWQGYHHDAHLWTRFMNKNALDMVCAKEQRSPYCPKTEKVFDGIAVALAYEIFPGHSSGPQKRRSADESGGRHASSYSSQMQTRQSRLLNEKSAFV